jgi:hypothetical protein
LWFKPSLGKQFTRPYLENTQNKTGLEEWLKWWSTCLASIRVQTSVWPKKNTPKQRKAHSTEKASLSFSSLER